MAATREFSYEAALIGLVVAGVLLAYFVDVFRRIVRFPIAVVDYLDSRADAQRAAMSLPEPSNWIRLARIVWMMSIVALLAIAFASTLQLF